MKYEITESRTEVIVMAIKGLSAFVRTSLRLTFKPRPTIAAVKHQVVSVETPFKKLSETGIECPRT